MSSPSSFSCPLHVWSSASRSLSACAHPGRPGHGRTVDVAASVGAATPATVGSRDLSLLQRAADAALYDGKHSGRAAIATAVHTTVPSVNGRRAGRPGTAVWGRAA
ncbi:hypothetical protein ACFY2Z_40670 [Streptomyces sp. NPDC001222]|uniref:hypothetical protein n=1 Tax=Streptomyces sp. NPDC001222 TaxID=3364548 RepID=UPI003682A5C3